MPFAVFPHNTGSPNQIYATRFADGNSHIRALPNPSHDFPIHDLHGPGDGRSMPCLELLLLLVKNPWVHGLNKRITARRQRTSAIYIETEAEIVFSTTIQLPHRYKSIDNERK